jgi:hypothetical protein
MEESRLFLVLRHDFRGHMIRGKSFNRIKSNFDKKEASKDMAELGVWEASSSGMAGSERRKDASNQYRRHRFPSGGLCRSVDVILGRKEVRPWPVPPRKGCCWLDSVYRHCIPPFGGRPSRPTRPLRDMEFPFHRVGRIVRSFWPYRVRPSATSERSECGPLPCCAISTSPLWKL